MGGNPMIPENKIVELALGRILLLSSRPEQPGDVEEYEHCRSIILNALGSTGPPDYQVNYARDHRKGAQGG